MKSKQKRLAVAALLLGVPLFLAFATKQALKQKITGPRKG